MKVTHLVGVFTSLVAFMSMVQCGKASSPTMPTSDLAVAGVALTATRTSVGGSVQGSIALTMAAPAEGATVSLSSTNTAVATVPAAVVVPGGSTTAAFSAAAVGVGTVAIVASLNGSDARSPQLSVGTAAIAAVSLSTQSVVGGRTVEGTVTLSGPAPSGGAIVTLSGDDPVTVPANATVPAGALSASFTVQTRAVGGTIPATIAASYGGNSATVVLSVTRPTEITANFGVRGPSESDTCTMANGGATLNCTFDGSLSTSPGTIVAYEWSFSVAKTFSQTTSGPVLTMPSTDCSLLPPPPFPSGVAWYPLVVKLTVRDDQGHVSEEAVDRLARVLPQGTCGY